MERVLDIFRTIKQLEARMQREEDPREKQDMAETLDLLESSLVYELEQISQDRGSDEKDNDDHAA